MSKKVNIEAMINADLQQVWDFYTNPKHIINWNFASDDWCCPKASNDLKVGGKYSARMEAKDGSFGFDFEGIYDEVEEKNKLTYSLEDGRQSTTIFENKANGTLVKTTFDAETQNSIDQQRDGWQAILNNFKSYVEAN
ncbi:SRPBCC family protein [Winogradskyella schleiferi]|uniref:SRPBCC family protein n=1 Tax=Winogradskyella schleiferi TaxID=2686078 RepID=UPI0015BBD698|nr:SRPBCC family protein [Winogradskyella schleiferi]